jgi:hypothetical protein
LGRIEIVRFKKLEKIYFRVPDICQDFFYSSLEVQQARKELLMSVTRINPEDKLKDFLLQIDDVWIVMSHKQSLRSRGWFITFIAGGDMWFQVLAFVAALVMNVLLVTECVSHSTTLGLSFGDQCNLRDGDIIYYMIVILSFLHVVLSRYVKDTRALFLNI